MVSPDTLKALEEQLAELKRQSLQEQFLEGARIHAEKNSPSVSGMYAHLKFPPYVFRQYPRMLYAADYPAAVKAMEQAQRIMVRGMDDSRELAIKLAQRRIDEATRTVQTEAEDVAQRASGQWVTSPDEAVTLHESQQKAMAAAAATREYDDRRLGESARREMRAYDDRADGHTPEIPRQPIRRRRGPNKHKRQSPAAVSAAQE